VQHPAIATFYEAAGDGVAFLAMEFVPGETCRSRSSEDSRATEALALSDALLEGSRTAACYIAASSRRT
jgi:hypothetical protein